MSKNEGNSDNLPPRKETENILYLRFWGLIWLLSLCEIFYVSYLVFRGLTVPDFDWVSGTILALVFPILIIAHALHHIRNHGFPRSPTPNDAETDRDLRDR
jgi:hypothetical protein